MEKGYHPSPILGFTNRLTEQMWIKSGTTSKDKFVAGYTILQYSRARTRARSKGADLRSAVLVASQVQILPRPNKNMEMKYYGKRQKPFLDLLQEIHQQKLKTNEVRQNGKRGDIRHSSGV